MRGGAGRQASIMLAVTPDAFVPADHPIRRIKPIVDAALQRLSPLFDTMYSTRGRPSIPSEHPLKASLLIALYSVRSERQFWAGPVISGTRAEASMRASDLRCEAPCSQSPMPSASTTASRQECARAAWN